MLSTFRGIGVVAVGVALPDLAVAAMDQKLRALMAGDVPPSLDGLALGRVDRRGPLRPRTFDSPAALMGDNILNLCYNILSLEWTAATLYIKNSYFEAI